MADKNEEEAPVADVPAVQKQEDPKPMAAPQQQAVPSAPVAPNPPVAQNPIAVLNNARIMAIFNRMDRDAQSAVHVVNIDNQDTLSGQTYDRLAAISTVALPITRANFIRIWKTLILKRTQDVYESEYKVRPDNYVRIARNIEIPATLADLLHALGTFYSARTGLNHIISPPARPADVPNFWNVDNNSVRDWLATMILLNKSYIVREFPSQRETSDRPLALTFRQVTDNYTVIKALTNEPRLTDGFIRLVNDDIFAAHARFDVNHCALNMTQRLNETAIRRTYINGYVTRADI